MKLEEFDSKKEVTPCVSGI